VAFGQYYLRKVYLPEMNPIKEFDSYIIPNALLCATSYVMALWNEYSRSKTERRELSDLRENFYLNGKPLERK
jgi:hypothetical protein